MLLDLWYRTSRPTRTATIVLMSLGALLTLAGVYGDGRDWWTGHAFALNLYSGATGACFAIPLALVGLRALSDAQARHSQFDTNAWRAKSELSSFFELADTLLLGPLTTEEWGDVRSELTRLLIRVTRESDDLDLSGPRAKLANLSTENRIASLRANHLFFCRIWKSAHEAAGLSGSGFETLFDVMAEVRIDDLVRYFESDSAHPWLRVPATLFQPSSLENSAAIRWCNDGLAFTGRLFEALSLISHLRKEFDKCGGR